MLLSFCLREEVGSGKQKNDNTRRIGWGTGLPSFFFFFLPVLYHKFFITAACFCPRHTGNLGNDATHRQAQGFVFRVVVQTSNHDGEANKTILSFRNLTEHIKQRRQTKRPMQPQLNKAEQVSWQKLQTTYSLLCTSVDTSTRPSSHLLAHIASRFSAKN